jgi:predicted nucleic acid-binding protein
VAECWIVNSSPLISLDRIGLLDILGRLGREVVIPRGVLDEIARGPAPITPSRLATHRTVVISAIDPIVAGWDLGRGESEVLTWAASQRQASAILDDLAARRCAASLGIEPHGTLFVLLEAKKAGLVPAVAPLIEMVRAKGLFVSDSLVAKVLRRAGETR